MIQPSTKTILWVGAALTVVTAAGLSLLASPDPDGLTKVAEEQGIEGSASPHAEHLGPLADYQFPLLDGPAGQAVAALIGVTVVLGLTRLVTRAVRRGKGA